MLPRMHVRTGQAEPVGDERGDAFGEHERASPHVDEHVGDDFGGPPTAEQAADKDNEAMPDRLH